MSQQHYYEVKAEWSNGRKGTLSSPVLNETMECATPPEFPKGEPGIWSPEHLYAAAISSCYLSTFLAVAENFKLPFQSFSCKTVCKLELVEGRFQITEAEITPELQLENPEQDRDKALKVLDKSKAACLVTNSMKTAVTLNIELL